MGSLLDELRIERRGESAPGAQSRRRRAWTRKTALAGAGLAIVAGTASAYFVSARPLAVDVFTVTGSVSASPTPPATLLTAGGYVRDARVVYVAPKVAGRIVSLSVREGDQVRAGVQIAALDSRDLAQEAAEARANYDLAAANLRKLEAGSRPEEIAERRAQVQALDLAQQRAERDLARARSLFSDGIITVQTLDQVETDARAGSRNVEAARQGLRLVEAGPRVEEIQTARAAAEAARARLMTATNRLEYGRVLAPVAGRVLRKFRNVGDFVSPDVAFIEGYETVAVGSPIVSLAATGEQEVAADINETDVAKIVLGQPVEIAPNAYPHETLHGTVSQISPRADKNKNTVEVKVGLYRSARILPYDLSVKLTFLGEARPPADAPPLRIPQTAVRRGREGPFVFVVSGGRASRRAVDLGSRFGDEIAVATGLSNGDRVILGHPSGITDGTPIRVK